MVVVVAVREGEGVGGNQMYAYISQNKCRESGVKVKVLQHNILWEHTHQDVVSYHLYERGADFSTNFGLT